MKKILLTALSVVLVAALAIGGTLAYLTDRDAKTNVFTVGNVDITLNDDFAQGSQLVPGVAVEKDVTVTNTGKNDAWVWVEIVVPTELKDAIALKGVSSDWKESKDSGKYAFMLKETLAAGATTSSVIEEVAFAANVDVTPEGDLYTVVNGTTTSIGWNIKDIPAIVVSAYAIQTDNFNTVEEAYAAYGNQWGANGGATADVPNVTEVATADELADALASGGVVVLTDDVKLDAAIGSDGKATHAMTVANGSSAVINLNGHNIEMTAAPTANNNYSLVQVKGDLTVSGNGTMAITHTGVDMEWNALSAVISVEGGSVTVGEGVVINHKGGTAMAYGIDVNSTLGETVANIDGAIVKSSYTGIRIFSNNKTEKAIVNFNKGFVEGDNRDIWNQVSSASIPAENSAVNITDNYNYTTEATSFGGAKYFFTDYLVATNDDGLDDAIKDGATTIVLADGNYVIPDSAQGKTLTIVGNGNTVIATQDDGSYEGCDYSLDGATVTFENVTINTDSHTYTGYARCKGTYNNCTINGTFTLYDNSEFNNCTFNVSGDVYNIWTWGAATATFNGCTFNSDGKAMLLYGTTNTTLTVDNCVFNDKGGLTDLKAAIEIGNDYGWSYTLIVNKTVVNGYEINDKGINTGTTLWGNKNSMGTDKLNVIVDGVDVY